jgi:hypothetical protein
MIYTDEQYEILSQAKPHFETVKRDYIRNAPKWLTEQIINVYEIATKKTILNKDMNCSICVMNIYKIIGKTYDADTKEREAKVEDTKVENVKEEAENVNEVTTKVTKKSKKSNK